VAVRDPSAAILEAARMVLSGVARTKGRFGKQLVAAMLCGSKSAKVSRWKLDTLSTFGILDGFTQTEANALLQALIDQGLVEQNEVDRFRPTVAITDRGSRVMRGDGGLEKSLSLPPELLAKVNTLYRDRQRDSGVVPDAVGLLSLRKPPPDKTSLAPDQRPTYYWTWRLLHDGYTAEECLAIRRLDLDRLVTDLLRAVAGEYPVQAAWVLRPEELAWLDDYMDPDSPEDREKLADSRPQRLGAELVEFYLRTRESNQEVGRT
jgi:hypothetical protein